LPVSDLAVGILGQEVGSTGISAPQVNAENHIVAGKNRIEGNQRFIASYPLTQVHDESILHRQDHTLVTRQRRRAGIRYLADDMDGSPVAGIVGDA
jgi:hypothetical protein